MTLSLPRRGQCTARRFFGMTVATVVLSATVVTAAQTGPWLGPELEALPFQTEDDVLDFLANAEVIDREVLTQGINQSEKLTLELEGTTAHAIFRSRHTEIAGKTRRGMPDRDVFRDSYVFEKAAYDLSRFLGVDRVPPTVIRTFENREGALQLWIEGAATAAKRLSPAQRALDPVAAQRQNQLMLVFDSLIHNFDRHSSNMLYDGSDTLWFIDHTRTFTADPKLPFRRRLTSVDRRFYEALRACDEEDLHGVLKPYLGRIERMALMARKRKLVRKFDRLIEEQGYDSVVYEVDRQRVGDRGTTS